MRTDVYIKIMRVYKGCMGCMKIPRYFLKQGGVLTPPPVRANVGFLHTPIHLSYTLIIFMHPVLFLKII